MTGPSAYRKRFGAAARRTRLPPAETASQAVDRMKQNEKKDVLEIKRLRFVEFMDEKLICLRFPHRTPEWVHDVIMGKIHAATL